MKDAVMISVKVLSHKNIQSNEDYNDGLTVLLSSRLRLTSTLLEYRIYLKIMVHDLFWKLIVAQLVNKYSTIILNPIVHCRFL
jgi:hypothetical protein